MAVLGSIQLLLAVGSLWAQAIIPPPVPLYPVFGRTTLFPAADVWLSLNQYPTNLQYQPFRWIFDTGTSLPILRAPGFELEGASRLIFRFQPAAGSEWMFYASDLITNLELQGWFRIGGLDLGVGYRHDCKHDVEQSRGRLIILDSVALSVTHHPIELNLGRSQHMRLYGVADAVLALPTIFQAGPAEPERFRIDGRIHLDALELGSSATLFAEGGAALSIRSTETGVAGIEPLNLDWHVRIGVHAPSASHGASLYLQVERLTDPWTLPEAIPVTLFSIGLTLASVGN
ncbi:hypothetical protein [Salinispira pacifica]